MNSLCDKTSVFQVWWAISISLLSGSWAPPSGRVSRIAMKARNNRNDSEWQWISMKDIKRALGVHFGTYFSSGGWDSHWEVRVSRIYVVIYVEAIVEGNTSTVFNAYTAKLTKGRRKSVLKQSPVPLRGRKSAPEKSLRPLCSRKSAPEKSLRPGINYSR